MATAQEDFDAKVASEIAFIAALNQLNKKIVREFTRNSAQGQVTNAQNSEEELVALLLLFFGRIANKFSRRIVLPRSVAMTTNERRIIDRALDQFNRFRSSEQAAIITNTTQKDMVESTAKAEQASEPDTNRIERAVLAGGFLASRLRGRAPGIAMTETQAVAEASKNTEVEVLIGQQPSIIVPSAQEVNLAKTWSTMGDNLVRPSHMVANGQSVLLNDVFLVQNQALRVPGDMSLGATIDNTGNCRCSSNVVDADIVDIRLNDDFIPLLTDMVEEF